MAFLTLEALQPLKLFSPCSLCNFILILFVLFLYCYAQAKLKTKNKMIEKIKKEVVCFFKQTLILIVWGILIIVVIFGLSIIIIPSNKIPDYLAVFGQKICIGILCFVFIAGILVYFLKRVLKKDWTRPVYTGIF